MIDLRKPLEGVPGLLLLGALVLFGATIGISLALVFSLVEMKDSLANFLGGIVGAGLGAALAVLGSVYLYERGRRESQIPIAADLHTTLDGVLGCLRELRALVVTTPNYGGMVAVVAQAQFLANHASEMSTGNYLPKPIGRATKALREQILGIHDTANGHIATPTEKPLPTLEELDGAIQLAETLRAQVAALE